MNFAKNLLGKYGWKEGDGLGKNNDGIAKPLKAAYKFNKSGLGHNQADDLNNHWWENVFNAAADNMNVTKDDDGVVSMERKTDESVEITTKNYSISSKADKNFYKGQFLRTSTLVNSGQEIEIADKDEVVFETVKMNPFKVVTDEDLLRACEGRTVHKGARHGLKMSGKLARIEAQEREMLTKMGLTYTQPIERVVQSEWTEIQSKKRSKKDKPAFETQASVLEAVEDSLREQDYRPKSMKKAKKHRKLDGELAQVFENALTTIENETPITLITNNSLPYTIPLAEVALETVPNKHKKKSKKDKKSSLITDFVVPEEVTSGKTSKRKRLESQADTVPETEVVTKSKNKSKKLKSEAPENVVDHFLKSEPIEVACSEREAKRKADKLQRKKDRQVRRLAKEMDQDMHI